MPVRSLFLAWYLLALLPRRVRQNQLRLVRTPTTQPSPQTAEKPDTVKFNEYFSDFYQKTILTEHIGNAIYDVVSKTYAQPKTFFPGELSAGGSGGCSSVDQSPPL